MSEETLSQAAIDAMLAGDAPAEAAPPPPPPPEPEPVAKAAPPPPPEPEQTLEPVAEPEQFIEAAPEPEPDPVPSPAPAAGPMPTPVAASAGGDELAKIKARLEKIEASLARIDSLEQKVKASSGQQGALDPDFIRRFEAVEVSVMGICQMQQEVPREDLMPKISALEREIGKVSRLERDTSKIARLEQELTDMNTTVQNLTSQLQNAHDQMRKIAGQAKKNSQGLKDTWGYQLKQNFECQECGSQGYVVGLVKCSDCGEEEWWGWWPPEDADYEDDFIAVPEGAHNDGYW